MTLLTDYSENINSQFGEDGIIRQCLTRMGLAGISAERTCIEVGASDGRECSNTLWLRDVWGWERYLYEADDPLFNRQQPHPLDHSRLALIEAIGAWSLDELTPVTPDFLSLDIDGDDFAILRGLQMRPKLICAEFNHTIPLGWDITGPQLGMSLSALLRLMKEKDYIYIGSNHCNAFFIDPEFESQFWDIDKDPEHYFEKENLTYLVSDPYGGVVAIGPQLFGVQKRFAGELDVMDEMGNIQTIRLTHRSTRPN